MGGRKHEATKSSFAKEAVKQWPWSELPPTTNPSRHRENILLKNNFRNAAGITKSWLATTTRCSSSNAHPQRQLRYVIADEKPNPTTTPSHRLRHFLDDPSDVVKALLESRDALRDYWCALKSDTKARIHPPRTYHPNHPGPTLRICCSFTDVHNGPTSGLMMHYSTVFSEVRYGSKYISIWHECTMGDPFDAEKKDMVFDSLVNYNGGKYYAITLQGALVMMEVDDTRLMITGVSHVRTVPYTAGCRFFKEYVVEMEGEHLLVFLIHEKSLAVVDGVEVYRLDFEKLGWIRVERLRGKTMFLKEKCIWVDSEEFGSRDDCVYFSNYDNSWCVYDMKTCCISPYSFQDLDSKI